MNSKNKTSLEAKIISMIESGRDIITTIDQLANYPIGSLLSYVDINNVFRRGGSLYKTLSKRVPKAGAMDTKIAEDYFIYLHLDSEQKIRVRMKNVCKIFIESNIDFLDDDDITIKPKAAFTFDDPIQKLGKEMLHYPRAALAARRIPEGLHQELDFITKETEKEILNWIDSQTWSTKLKRRTQHYGYEYDYKTRKVNKCDKFVSHIESLGKCLSDKFGMEFDQCIVNEYVKDQGITPHIDAAIFDDVIVCISLGSEDEMIFKRGDKKHKLKLFPRSVMIMKGAARTYWYHEIKSRYRCDDFRRVSITFRKVK